MNTRQHQRCVLLIIVLISLFFAPLNVLPSSDIEEFKNAEENEHIQSERYALLFGGGFNNKNNLESFYTNIEYVYDALRQLGYKKKNIKTLFFGGETPKRPIIEGEATRKRLLTELDNFAAVMGSEDSLLLFRSGHGIIELVFDKHSQMSPGTEAVMQLSDGCLSPTELQEKLLKIQCEQIIFILSQCFSGPFTEIAKNIDNIVIITETDALGYAIHQTQMKTGWKYAAWPFVKCLFDGFLDQNSEASARSVAYAFAYMLEKNPNIIGFPIRADRPLLKENPQIRYGKKLIKGTVYLD
jgi:hypothetical protein